MPGYDYRTGDPRRDNQARRMNRALHQTLRHLRISTPGGWRRKKAILKHEGPRFLVIVVEAALLVREIEDFRQGRL